VPRSVGIIREGGGAKGLKDLCVGSLKRQRHQPMKPVEKKGEKLYLGGVGA